MKNIGGGIAALSFAAVEPILLKKPAGGEDFNQIIMDRFDVQFVQVAESDHIYLQKKVAVHRRPFGRL